ncbi:MAG: lysostaphin resistance A-like protein [Oscillospiraceae bacterium]
MEDINSDKPIDIRDSNNNVKDTEYTFVHSMGFINMSDKERKVANIRRNATVLAFCLILLILISIVFKNDLYIALNTYFNNKTSIVDIGVVYQIVFLIQQVSVLIIPFTIYYLMSDYENTKILNFQNVDFVSVLHIVFAGVSFYQLAKFLTYASLNLLSYFGINIVFQSVLPPVGASFTVYILNTVFLISFVEEFIFRGVLLLGLQKNNVILALVVQSIVFAFFKGNLESFIANFVLAAFLGYIYILTKNFLLIFLIRVSSEFFEIFTDFIYSKNSLRNSSILINFFLLSIFILGFISCQYIIKYINLNKKIHKKDKDIRTFEVIKSFALAPTMLICYIATLIWVIS